MKHLSVCIVFLGLCAGLSAQPLPDLFHFQFNEGSGTTTVNAAVPGVGTSPASITGHVLTPAPAGQFADGCLLGGGGTGVETGWPMNFGSGDWTISHWLDVSGASSTTSLMYFFGDPVGGSFRSFNNGVAGVGNVILRGASVADVIIPGAAAPSGPSVVTWVHRSGLNVIEAYLNGVLVVTVNQPALNLVSTSAFRVGGQLSGLLAGTLMDEFRVWSVALSASEVALTWNQGLSPNPATLVVVGAGCPGGGGVAPTLSSTQLPSLGNATFSLDLLQAAPNAQAYLYLSIGLAPNPIPVGGACLLYLDVLTLVQLGAQGISPLGPVTTNTFGQANFPLPVPGGAPFVGLPVGLQAAVVDPSAATGFTVSNALLATLN